MAEDPHSVGDILDSLCLLGERKRDVAIADIVERLGHRSHGPFLLVPALIEMSPIGAIPGLPTFLAVTIAIVAVQIPFGRDHLYLPGFIARSHVSGAKLRKATGKLRGIARFMDRHFRRRLNALTGRQGALVASVAVIALCCTVPPLEFLPFASTAPMAAIAAFGLALLARDGALMILALLLSAGTAALGISLLVGGGA